MGWQHHREVSTPTGDRRRTVDFVVGERDVICTRRGQGGSGDAFGDRTPRLRIDNAPRPIMLPVRRVDARRAGSARPRTFVHRIPLLKPDSLRPCPRLSSLHIACSSGIA